MSLKLLFVCTGNTCRSPMAEALAKKIFGDAVQVSSTGLAASPGQRASTYVLEILNEQGIDFSAHGSRMISAELVEDADWIIPMTEAQGAALRSLFPEHIHKIRRLGDWGEGRKDIADPWNGSLEVYRQTAWEIEASLAALKKELFSG